MRVRNWNSPSCTFPKSANVWDVLEPFIGSPVELLCLDLQVAMIEVGTKLYSDLSLTSNKLQAAKKMEHKQDIWDE